MKKTFVVLLACFIVFGLLFGCTNNSPNQGQPDSAGAGDQSFLSNAEIIEACYNNENYTCIESYAVKQKDESICLLISDTLVGFGPINGCIRAVAIEKKDPSICSKSVGLDDGGQTISYCEYEVEAAS